MAHTAFHHQVDAPGGRYGRADTRRHTRAGTRTTHRGPLRRQDAGGLRRAGRQDRAAWPGRSLAQVAPAARGHVRVVGSPVAQQAIGVRGPAPARGPGHRAPAGARGRRADRELPPRHAGEMGPVVGRAARAESAPHHAARVRLRPDRPQGARAASPPSARRWPACAT